MFIRDLQGEEYFLEGVVKHEDELNGDERIDIDIAYTKNNAEFLKNKKIYQCGLSSLKIKNIVL